MESYMRLAIYIVGLVGGSVVLGAGLWLHECNCREASLQEYEETDDQSKQVRNCCQWY